MKALVERATSPVWECISVESLIALINYQWEYYGEKLYIITDAFEGVEALEEISMLMKQKPRLKGKGWRG